eukprot:COSAG01_NODE_3081_length_6620_cov_26.409230_4_plen_150_part_00
MRQPSARYHQVLPLAGRACIARRAINTSSCYTVLGLLGQVLAVLLRAEPRAPRSRLQRCGGGGGGGGGGGCLFIAADDHRRCTSSSFSRAHCSAVCSCRCSATQAASLIASCSAIVIAIGIGAAGGGGGGGDGGLSWWCRPWRRRRQPV